MNRQPRAAQRGGQRVRRPWVIARLDPDTAGGLRLTLTALAAVLVLVPFTVLLGLVSTSWGPLHHLDYSVADRLNRDALTRPGLVTFLKGVCDVLSPTVYIVLGVVVCALLVLRRSRRLAAWLAVTVLLSDPLNSLVKTAVGRARPHFVHPVAAAASPSFPSGHAVGSVAALGALLVVGLPHLSRGGRRVAIGAWVAVILLVGYARVGLGVHYVSDVVAGWVVGAAWLMATTAAFRAWRHDLHYPDRPLTAGLEPAGPEQPAAPHRSTPGGPDPGRPSAAPSST